MGYKMYLSKEELKLCAIYLHIKLSSLFSLKLKKLFIVLLNSQLLVPRFLNIFWRNPALSDKVLARKIFTFSTTCSLGCL